jgi:hypothetical protein
MTYRQFINCLKGFRKNEDAQSKERLIIMRKIAYSALLPHLAKGTTETAFMPFVWEQHVVNKITEKDKETILAELESVKEFWSRLDAKKNKC